MVYNESTYYIIRIYYSSGFEILIIQKIIFSKYNYSFVKYIII